jgi:hypothetical protein
MTPPSAFCPHPGFWNCRLMSMVCIQVGLLLAVCCSTGSPEKSADPSRDIPSMQQKLLEINRREKALKAEYSLARNSAPYLVIHPSEGTLELKARGRSLRRFKVKEISKWDTGTDKDAIWEVSAIRAIQKAERPKIRPGAGEEATAEAAKQNLWGLNRMPLDYNLICDGSNILQIRGMPSSRSGFSIARSFRALYRRSLDRFRRWKAARNPQMQHVIQLWLDEDDSRLLFWSLPKQIKILIIPQSSGPAVSAQDCLFPRTPAALSPADALRINFNIPDPVSTLDS